MCCETMPISDLEKEVLVTGGGGFIGSRLVHALLEIGCKVKVIDIQVGYLKGESNQNLELIGVGSDELHGGIADKELVEQAVEEVDVIYHLAINWDSYTWRHELPLADLFHTNIKGTLNLLEAGESQGVRHFLFSSSCAVYGKVNTLFREEGSVCKPELWDGSPGPAYGILKLTLEKLCLMYHHQYGLPVSAFRIDVAFDDNEAQLPRRQIVEKVLKGEVVEVIEGEGCSSIHVDEIVQAFLLATLNKKAYGQVFNLSNPATYMSFRELYQFIIQLTNSKSEVRLNTNPMLIVSAPESIDKIKNTLGWIPHKTKEDLKKAIIHSIQSILHSQENRATS